MAKAVLTQWYVRLDTPADRLGGGWLPADRSRGDGACLSRTGNAIERYILGGMLVAGRGVFL
jgi:hypothetical protein